VLAAGAAKAGLDPYLPQSRPGIAREKRVLEELHDEFVATVKRCAELKSSTRLQRACIRTGST
jgi:hypothetical protein